ncbi:RNA-binding protein [Rhodopirellula baltica]|nr:RNA-binding protein [Rhodopirellula baltica]
MAVDLEAIARRGRCDVSSLKLALPLLEQGYEAPFLARYRRDELGGIDESTLWALKAAVQQDEAIAAFRDELYATWEASPLKDPAIGDAIRKSGSNRTLGRLSKRLRQETASGVDSDTNRLAVRLLNPEKGDSEDAKAVAEALEGIADAEAAAAGLASALPHRLAGDPRVISAAVRWLSRNAKIHISDVHDPHIGGADDDDHDHDDSDSHHDEDDSSENTVAESKPAADENAAEEVTATAEPAGEASESNAEPASDAAGEPKADASAETAAGDGETAPADQAASSPGDAADLPSFKTDAEENTTVKEAKKPPAPKKKKKISPRQRRRRWLVSVLKPLEGKRLPASKLSAFQVVMLGRALRSQVAVCSFEYDAAKLVAEIKKSVVGLNRKLEATLSDLVMQHEADIREAAEAAWWDELHERASTRLVGVVTDHLRKHINRGPLDAKVVMSIDAVGPKTAATAIVNADGRVLHGEDLPCQLSGNVRGQAVAKMGELIHQYNVDLVIVSNGPARRACLIALGDLIGQSPDGSIRWTVADRTGADTYASSDVANSEMRSTPRRFRAAAWIAFSVLHPAQAYAKVDPLRLRLASFQSELADDALEISLSHLMSSGASRGGVDVNAAALPWLEQLPGMDQSIANALVQKRESNLFSSRNELLEIAEWETAVQSRQALPFLRVFGSDEALDGTLIHPDDYVLAKKLATALSIELPPSSPPGYQAPSYDKAADEPKLVDATTPAAPAPVEDFDTAGDKASEFSLPEGESTAEMPAQDAEATTDSPAPTESETAEPAAAETTEASSEEAAESAPAESAAEPEAASEPAADAGDTPESEPVRRPRPEKAKIDKCIKEWQVGRYRVAQLVDWLCDPFGETANSGDPPGVLNTMPTLKTLQPGDQVIGVVVGVMSFGVFVELAPDCSGLIHVSRLSDGYVEDLNEAIQVGDVVTAWVTGIDEKRRRVGLSALSPEREQELEKERQTQRFGRATRLTTW